ncbi:hypothetical protein ABIE91_002805 [Bradyrhizobium elkanii]
MIDRLLPDMRMSCAHVVPVPTLGATVHDSGEEPDTTAPIAGKAIHEMQPYDAKCESRE